MRKAAWIFPLNRDADVLLSMMNLIVDLAGCQPEHHELFVIFQFFQPGKKLFS